MNIEEIKKINTLEDLLIFKDCLDDKINDYKGNEMDDIVTKINELKNILPEDDWFQFAIDLKIEEETEKYKSIHSVTKKELNKAAMGLRRSMNVLIDEEIKQNIRITKIDKIISLRDCDDCKYSEYKQMEAISCGAGFMYDPSHNGYSDCDFCKSCNNRINKLDDLRDDIRKTIEHRYLSQITPEKIELNAIIIKIKKKLSKIKES